MSPTGTFPCTTRELETGDMPSV